MTTTVGIVGTGLMGLPMARNMLRAGLRVVAYNRTGEKVAPLVREGAKQAASPASLAAECDVVLTIVSDPPALESVLWGSDGVLAGLKSGALLVDSSTVTPALARRAAADCAARGASFLDAPVTGGTWGAEKGELVFIVGGEAAVLDRARPVLDSMGKKFFHVGPHGAGQTVKIAMNLILALEVQALAEALALVGHGGVGVEKLLEVLRSSMANAAVLDIKAPLMVEQRYEPSFPLRLMHKDLGLAVELGNQIGVPLPAAAAARETYSAVKARSERDLDYAAIASFWQK